MTLTIDLTPDVQARLEAAATREGIQPAECVERLLSAHLPALHSADRTLELFARWAAEDATDDPEEIAARNQEWEELRPHLESRTLSLRTPAV